jgi:N-acetylmuramoyl-L-alanine amidase
MSANSTRIEGEATPHDADAGALQEGNRVLESIARQEAVPSLLAFSELHERIRARHASAQSASDLGQAERFVLDEVLQLISDRALALTAADGVMIALAQGASIVCRAASGSVLVERGTPLSMGSGLLVACLESGSTVRCDDVETDPRAEFDVARQVGAASTVLVPLRGIRARLGVLQAFSKVRPGFTNDDVRCLDLFAELLLSALKPEDQDRRISWLTGLASAVLNAKPAAKRAAEPEPPVAEIYVPAKPDSVAESSAIAPNSPAPKPSSLVPAPSSPAPEPGSPTSSEVLPLLETVERYPELKALLLENAPEAQEKPARTGAARWMPDLASFTASRPGLSVVLGLVAVASLFSAGVWWGMQVHSPASARTEDAATSLTAPTFAPAVPLTVSDNLMDPAKFAPEASVPASPSDNRALARITGVRHWSSEVGSTVVVDMEDQVPYEVHRLMSPERIYFDLHDSALAPALNGQSIDIGEAALSRVRIAQPVPGVTRVVLDTKDGSNFAVSMESDPYRLVIELRGNNRALAGKRAPLSAETASLAPAPLKPAENLPATRTGKFRIVLDPGHGGWDLGTVGRQGMLEKNLVLDVTERLGKLLQARLGAEVLFTRTGDEYLALDQRANFANQSQADLFVSVHANYSKSADARGIETYYTNFFSAPGSKEIEQRENGAAKPVTVSLSPAALREKLDESRRLAASVQRALYAMLAPTNPDIRDRGTKASAFVVLTGTAMPAILTEISFVSSPADERNLQSEAYRQQIAEALYKGISRYQESAPHAKVAQLQQSSPRR